MSSPLLWLSSRKYFQRVLGTAPIAYWPLWDTSGTAATELVAGLNGTHVNVTPGVIGANLLANGGFETAGTGGADVFGSWNEVAGDGAIADEVTLIHSGSHACKLTAGATANTSNSQLFTVVPGRSYSFVFWTRGDGTNAGRYSVSDSTNAVVIVNITSTSVPGTAYVRVVVPFTAPAGCVAVRVYTRCSDVNGGIAYFDDASVYETGANGIGDGRWSTYYDGFGYTNIYSAGLAAAFNGAEGSLMVWAKVSGVAVWTDGLQHVVARLAADADQNGLQIDQVGNNTMRCYYEAGNVQKTVSITTSSVGWLPLVMTWNTAADALIGYVNGAQSGAAQTGLSPWVGALSSTRCAIGSAAGNAATSSWSGWIGPVALWNRALTPGEVARLARP